jgi:hypothetical protein
MKKNNPDLVIKIKSEKENYPKINQIFNINSTDFNSFWEYSVPSSSIKEAYTILQERFELLESINISKDDISLWLYYKYDNQCNMEFMPVELNLLSKLNIAFCISCWEKYEY